MARSNPGKKKPRRANRALLIYGEGDDDVGFLKHLRSIYSHNSGVYTKIFNANGGSPFDMVNRTANKVGQFNHRLLMIDKDRPTKELKEAKKLADIHKIELIENKPCLEAMLLKILNPSKTFSNKRSKWCKDEFELKYLSKNKSRDILFYAKIFPKSVINSQIERVPELKRVLNLMRGFFD